MLFFSFTDDTAVNMASLSGSMDLTTKTFVSASNFMVIKFKTDGSVEKSGFRASWRTEAQTCGGDLVATPAPQILASPNYPRNYPGKKCFKTKTSKKPSNSNSNSNLNLPPLSK